MRAYMSTGADARSRRIEWSRHLPECAEREARTILAETEPEAIAWDTPKFGHHVTLDRMGCSAYYALAEALAGFIGMEC